MDTATKTAITALTASVTPALHEALVARAGVTTKTELVRDVAEEIAPIIVNQANAEPWYQSRVTWGVIIAGASTILKPFVGELPIDAQQTADIVNALATAGQAIGFGLTLYGRWIAKKPLGA